MAGQYLVNESDSSAFYLVRIWSVLTARSAGGKDRLDCARAAAVTWLAPFVIGLHLVGLDFLIFRIVLFLEFHLVLPVFFSGRWFVGLF